MRWITLLALLCGSFAAFAEELGTTREVGATGFATGRPVLAAACPHGCPWGAPGELVQEALRPHGYEVILCRNCNRA